MGLHEVQHRLKDIADIESFWDILTFTPEDRLVSDHEPRTSHEVLN
jgi:hypothetical protein